MSKTLQVWFWIMMLPLLTFFGETICLWSAPRWLGSVAILALYGSVCTIFAFLAALPAAIYFAVTSLIYWKKEGEFVQRVFRSAACLYFMGLWLLAFGWSMSLRHAAFERASHVGDRIIQALAEYHTEKGQYPERLEQLVPDYLGEIPYTGMIGYPDFRYRKDYYDTQFTPGEYELRINCTSGAINFDRFIYWPSEVYPNRIQGNGVERIRAWAYVHE